MIESLYYPFDIDVILRKKKSLKRELLAENRVNYTLNIAVLGGSTTSEIVKILELFLLKNGVAGNFYESEYNKFYEDAVFGNAELDGFKPDIIYIHTTNVNIAQYPSIDLTNQEIDSLVKQETEKFKSIWTSLQKFSCAIIQNNFELPINRSLGNLDAYDIHGKTHFINCLNFQLAVSAREISNLYINDINYLSAQVGLSQWFNRNLWHTAKYAVSFDAIPLLAQNIASIIMAIVGKTKKCLVLDLDNTCWGGVIGDDGLNGIQIGNETATGESYMYFQKYVKELKERGIILAVSSKNNHEIAIEGFTHSDSVLSFEDFAIFKANWEPKTQNIQEIATEINIGLDSLVFIDDNSAERHIVISQLPEVAVPDVGADVMQFVDYIEKNGYFEITSLSNDDVNRNKFYKNNSERAIAQSKFSDYNEYLESLDMIAEIKPFSLLYIDRITQLINKTNQFNVTTKRYTIGEVQALIDDDNYITLYGKLADKFGDNGLVSILIGKINGRACHIDLWLMSCRVLKRNMEQAMFDSFINRCKQKNVNEIIGCYYKTAKNDMVSGLFESFGFELLTKEENESKWKLSIHNYEVNNRIITIKNE
jgi:FkbH-like protein